MRDVRLYTIREASERLRCTEQTTRRLVHDGHLSAIRRGGPGSQLLIPAEVLADHLFRAPGEED